ADKRTLEPRCFRLDDPVALDRQPNERELVAARRISDNVDHEARLATTAASGLRGFVRYCAITRPCTWLAHQRRTNTTAEGALVRRGQCPKPAGTHLVCPGSQRARVTTGWSWSRKVRLDCRRAMTTFRLISSRPAAAATAGKAGTRGD